MTLEQRLNAFENLGVFLSQFDESSSRGIQYPELYNQLNDLIKSLHYNNGWFTEENVLKAISSISNSLSADNIRKWINQYLTDLLLNNTSNKKVAVIMAGNIPMVGFHDMLSVLISGHYFIGKVSSKDDKLLPLIAEILCTIEPEFKPFIQFTNNQLKDFDAVIATGSNNSATYFNYYFSRYPHVIRKNRNSIAVLTGNETKEELSLLGNDIFRYFGLGCRNVSKLYVPKNYSFNSFYESIEHYSYLLEHNKYANNHAYYMSILLLNKTPFLDNNFLIVKEDISMHSPVANIYYEYYINEEHLNQRISQTADGIQCILSSNQNIPHSLTFGCSQEPMLWDYADGVDTMQFLIKL